MPQKYVRATGVVQLASAADVLSISEAAVAVGRASRFIADAIRREREKPGTGLPAFVPFGAERAGGRGRGYLIHKSDLERWWFGKETPDAT